MHICEVSEQSGKYPRN